MPTKKRLWQQAYRYAPTYHRRPSACSSSSQNLGLIIIDEEHDKWISKKKNPK